MGFTAAQGTSSKTPLDGAGPARACGVPLPPLGSDLYLCTDTGPEILCLCLSLPWSLEEVQTWPGEAGRVSALSGRRLSCILTVFLMPGTRMPRMLGRSREAQNFHRWESHVLVVKML